MATGHGWWFRTQYQKNQWQDMDYRKMPFEKVIYEKLSDSIVRLTFNRPERRNALDDQEYNEFLGGLNRANDDPDVKVVILKGAGPSFGAGHELSSPNEEESPPVHPSVNPNVVDYYGFERRRCSKYEDVLNYPKITIAQVHGNCVGAHEILAGMCDIFIAADDARFGARGFGRRPCGITNWPAFWPLESNKYWGGQLSPEIAGKAYEEMGLVTKSVPAEKLEEETMKWAKALSNLPIESIAVYKEWAGGMQDVIGLGSSYRNHYGEHLSLQFVRFRPDEVNFYRTKKSAGGNVRAYIKERQESVKVKDTI